MPFAKVCRLAALTASLTLCASAVFAAEVVVLSVKGVKTWTRGQVLAEGTPIDLPAGAELTVVTEEEKILTLTGPLHEPIPATPAAAAEDSSRLRAQNPVLRALAAVLSAHGALEALLVRGPEASPASDPWWIDLETGGDKCVHRDTTPTFWYSAPARSTTLWIQAIGRGREEIADWRADSDIVDWPRQMPIVDGGRYLVASPALRQERLLTLHVAPDVVISGVAAATWMLSQQCNDQAARLLLALPPAAIPVRSTANSKPRS